MSERDPLYNPYILLSDATFSDCRNSSECVALEEFQVLLKKRNSLEHALIFLETKAHETNNFSDSSAYFQERMNFLMQDYKNQITTLNTQLHDLGYSEVLQDVVWKKYLQAREESRISYLAQQEKKKLEEREMFRKNYLIKQQEELANINKPSTPSPIILLDNKKIPKMDIAPEKNTNRKRILTNEMIGIVLAVAAFIFPILIVIWNPWNSYASEPVYTTPPTSEQTPQLEQAPQLEIQTRPRSGHILRGNGASGSEITITASTDEDHVVSLKDVDHKTQVVFYVRAGDTVTVNVPSKLMYVYFASGKDWYGYGKGKMFGEYTFYSMDDELLDFVNYSWEYTLTPMVNGNFSDTPIEDSDFF